MDNFPEAEMGVLCVKTEQAEKLRVTLLHHIKESKDLILSWRLLLSETPVLSSMRVPDSSDFRWDSFTVDVPSKGVHQVAIQVSLGVTGTHHEHRGTYRLRRIWVTRVQPQQLDQ
jgi:hypothetical protein